MSCGAHASLTTLARNTKNSTTFLYFQNKRSTWFLFARMQQFAMLINECNFKFQLTASAGPVFTKSVSWRPLFNFIKCERISQQSKDTLQPHIQSAIKHKHKKATTTTTSIGSTQLLPLTPHTHIVQFIQTLLQNDSQINSNGKIEFG